MHINIEGKRSYILLLAISLSLSSVAQTNFPFSAILKDTTGKPVDSKSFTNNGKPIIIDFWASWCMPCIIKYNSMKKVYKKWQEETGVRIISISLDKTPQAMAKAKQIAAKNGWPFELVFDDEKKLLTQLTTEESVPHSFFYDKDVKLVTEKLGASISKKGKGDDLGAVQELMEKKSGDIEDFEVDLDDYYKIIKKIAGSAIVK